MRATSRLAASLIVGATLAGCDANTTQPQLQSTLLARTSSSNADGLPLHVHGKGETDVINPPPAVGIASWEFNAIVDGSGKAHGHFSMIRQRAGFTVDFSGEVTCIGYDPVNNRAWIGGVVTENRSDDPAHTTAIHQPGRDVWFRITDQGKNGNPDVDRSTVLGFEGAAGIITSAEYCTVKPWTANNANAFEVINGDIRIKAD